MSEDLSVLRAYIVAKDGHEYDSVPDGTVCLQITHSNLRAVLVDIRLDLHATIAHVREKVYRHCGTQPDAMELSLFERDGSLRCALTDDSKMLGFYGVQNGMRLHVVDTDPFSISRGGALENTDLVAKYEISEEDYDKRAKTVRAYKREQLAKDPNWKPKAMMMQATPPQAPAEIPGPETIASMHIGDRCEVQPGSRRGTVQYLGPVAELADGMWVGVVFDEPVGKSSGTIRSSTYFECADKFGGFIRPKNVTIGDFPVEDLFDDSDDEL